MLFQCQCRDVQVWTERSLEPELVCSRCGQRPTLVIYSPRPQRSPQVERVLVDLGVEEIEAGGCAPSVLAR